MRKCIDTFWFEVRLAVSFFDLASLHEAFLCGDGAARRPEMNCF